MLTMYDNKVRFFFSIENVSQEHYIFPLYAKRNDYHTTLNFNAQWAAIMEAREPGDWGAPYKQSVVVSGCIA